MCLFLRPRGRVVLVRMICRLRANAKEKPIETRGHRKSSSKMSISRNSVERRHHVEMIICSAALTRGCLRMKASWKTLPRRGPTDSSSQQI